MFTKSIIVAQTPEKQYPCQVTMCLSTIEKSLC